MILKVFKEVEEKEEQLCFRLVKMRNDEAGEISLILVDPTTGERLERGTILHINTDKTINLIPGAEPVFRMAFEADRNNIRERS